MLRIIILCSQQILDINQAKEQIEIGSLINCNSFLFIGWLGVQGVPASSTIFGTWRKLYYAKYAPCHYWPGVRGPE